MSALYVDPALIPWASALLIAAVVAAFIAHAWWSKHPEPTDPQTLKQFLGLAPDTKLHDLMSEDES